MSEPEEFDWSPLGESKWRALGAQSSCTEAQLRFGVLRFQGNTQIKSAALAYASANTPDSARNMGHSANRSRAVQNLLELGIVEAPGTCRLKDYHNKRLMNMVRDFELALMTQQLGDGQLISSLIRSFTTPNAPNREAVEQLKQIFRDIVKEKQELQCQP
jgi:hypothetical protein